MTAAATPKRPRAATPARLLAASRRVSNDQGAALRPAILARYARPNLTRGAAAQPAHSPRAACFCAACVDAFSTPFAEVFP